jgi:hypothetical protein
MTRNLSVLAIPSLDLVDVDHVKVSQTVDRAQVSQKGWEGARTGPFEGESGQSGALAGPPIRVRACSFPQF